jgi:hypothetical protein
MLIDAVSGTPLRGDVFPFAFVELQRCLDDSCSAREVINSQPTDVEGRFVFTADFGGVPLTADRYQVAAFADQFQPGQTPPFQLGPGEDHDIGDLPLTPLPIQFFAGIRAVTSRPLEGRATLA